MNSVGIQVLSHTSTTSNDKNTMTKVDRRNIIRKKKHTCFEWTQLIATICIPLIIAVYNIIENHNNELIAAADLHKDVEIANNSRTSGFEIAQADRLNEIIIAEQSRQNDRDLTVDQQRENILVQSLYEAKLITLKITSKPLDKSVLEFRHVDLSDLTLGSSRDSPDERPMHHYIDWYYLYLPYAILTNASFRHSNLDCATFTFADMNSVDLSFATHAYIKCFGAVRDGQTDFTQSSLVSASLYKVHFSFTHFSGANLTLANMRGFRCTECQFWSTILFQVD